MGAYDPIAILMEEHEQFRERLGRFAAQMQALASPPRVPSPVVRQIAEFGHFLARDVDGWHGRKEEEALFPALGSYLPVDAGPIGVMLSEHGLLREHQRSIERSAERLAKDPEAIDALATAESAEHAIRALLTDHIEKEDHVLFPMARSLLSERELDEVAELCQAIDARRASDTPP